MSAHTPGPWIIWRQPSTGHWNVGIGPKKVVSLTRNTIDGEANARLIAAAPDLLDALEYCKEQLSRYVTMLDPECTCEPCPECGKMPSECTGTECAQTCQCNECDHCHGVMAVAAASAAIYKATLK